MSYNLWMAKFHHNCMMKYQRAKEKCKQREEESKKLMQSYLDDLDTVDYFRFAADTGYITKKK